MKCFAMLLLMTVALTANAEAPAPASAQDAAQDLSTCLADHTSGADRKALARWVFLAMAAHPELKPYVAPAATAAEAPTDRTIADLVVRLLAKDCSRQAQSSIANGDTQAMSIAFQSLGQLAMQELMTNPDVTQSVARFQKQLDGDRLKQALSLPAAAPSP